MASKKIITVFGATGAAGGSVAKYLLDDGTFAVRAATRNVNSDKATALIAKGAEIVEADLDKPETLVAAIAGSYGVLGMTDFWTLLPTLGFDTARTQAAEEVQGRNIIDAAKAAGIQHFVFLSLPGPSGCPHFQGKHQVSQYLKSAGVPYTDICTAMYFENLIESPRFFIPDGRGGGEIVIPHPADKYMPAYSVDQTGGWALEAFKKPETWLGKDMRVIGEHITPRQMAATLSTVLGKPIGLREKSLEEFNAFDSFKPSTPQEVVLYELHTMFRDMIDTSQPPNSIYDEAASAKVYPPQHNFEKFVRENERFKAWVTKLSKA